MGRRGLDDVAIFHSKPDGLRVCDACWICDCERTVYWPAALEVTPVARALWVGQVTTTRVLCCFAPCNGVGVRACGHDMSVSAASESALRTTRAQTIAARLCAPPALPPSLSSRTRMHADPRPALVFLRLGMEQRSARQRCPEAERWVPGSSATPRPHGCLPAHDDAAARAALPSPVPACRTPHTTTSLLLRVVVLVRTRTRGGPAGRGPWARLLSP